MKDVKIAVSLAVVMLVVTVLILMLTETSPLVPVATFGIGFIFAFCATIAWLDYRETRRFGRRACQSHF